MMQNESMNSPEQFKKSAFAFGMMFQKFAKSTATVEGCEKIAAKVAQWDMMKIFGVFMAIAEPMRCGLKVLNHGDDWLNNMMFKSEAEGTTVDVKLIDFQMSFWGSPANDLIYFFVSSVADDVKTKFFDDLIAIYHGELESSLVSLGYDQHIPTISELQIDLLEKGSACE
jgi:thiamine kinase-like enzyme